MSGRPKQKFQWLGHLERGVKIYLTRKLVGGFRPGFLLDGWMKLKRRAVHGH